MNVKVASMVCLLFAVKMTLAQDNPHDHFVIQLTANDTENDTGRLKGTINVTLDGDDFRSHEPFNYYNHEITKGFTMSKVTISPHPLLEATTMILTYRNDQADVKGNLWVSKATLVDGWSTSYEKAIKVFFCHRNSTHDQGVPLNERGVTLHVC